MDEEFDWLDLLSIEVAIEGADVVVAVSGDLDLSSAAKLSQGVQQAAALAAGRVVLDLAALGFIDAAGLRVLLEANRSLGLRFAVRSPSRQVRRLFAVTGLGNVLPVEPGTASARAGPGDPAKIAYVRRLWEAFRIGGAPAVAELVPDQVEWRPWQGQGRRLRSTREMREFWATSSAPAPVATDFCQLGSDVLVRCELPLSDGSVKELWAVYHFDGDRLVRAVSFEEKAQAVNAAAP